MSVVTRVETPDRFVGPDGMIARGTWTIATYLDLEAQGNQSLALKRAHNGPWTRYEYLSD